MLFNLQLSWKFHFSQWYGLLPPFLISEVSSAVPLITSKSILRHFSQFPTFPTFPTFQQIFMQFHWSTTSFWLANNFVVLKNRLLTLSLEITDSTYLKYIFYIIIINLRQILTSSSIETANVMHFIKVKSYFRANFPIKHTSDRSVSSTQAHE